MTGDGPSWPGPPSGWSPSSRCAAVATEQRHVDPPHRRPAVVLPESGRWQVAVAVPLPAGVVPGGCGLGVGPLALAVSHPVLPCGVRVVLEAGRRTASVQVAGPAAAPGGAAFSLALELARVLGLAPGAAPVTLRWALAAS